MEDAIIALCCSNNATSLTAPPSPYYHLSYLTRRRRRNLQTHFPILSSNTSISLPSPHLSKPSKTQPPPPPIIPPSTQFGEKMLYLESIGFDFFALIHDHPSIISSLSLQDIKSTVHYMRSLGFSSLDFRRICGMCPEILTYKISDIAPVFTFLLREANVKGRYLRRVIHRRPRLLVCSVEHQLRPTLYFLQSLGITQVQNHTSLLSCNVEDKFMPRLDYLEKNMGFSYRDAISMVRRFPQLFCYSIKTCFEPKFNYFVMEMGRDIKELKEFPQYFSFSLDNRIKPRHLSCVAKGVYLPLPVMLKTHETMFRHRLEVCCSSSPPLASSPLWWSTSNFFCIWRKQIPVKAASVRSSSEVMKISDEEGDGEVEEEEGRRDHDSDTFGTAVLSITNQISEGEFVEKAKGLLVEVAVDLDDVTVGELNMGGDLGSERIEEGEGDCDDEERLEEGGDKSDESMVVEILLELQILNWSSVKDGLVVGADELRAYEEAPNMAVKEGKKKEAALGEWTTRFSQGGEKGYVVTISCFQVSISLDTEKTRGKIWITLEDKVREIHMAEGEFSSRGTAHATKLKSSFTRGRVLVVMTRKFVGPCYAAS